MTKPTKSFEALLKALETDKTAFHDVMANLLAGLTPEEAKEKIMETNDFSARLEKMVPAAKLREAPDGTKVYDLYCSGSRHQVAVACNGDCTVLHHEALESTAELAAWAKDCFNEAELAPDGPGCACQQFSALAAASIELRVFAFLRLEDAAAKYLQYFWFWNGEA